MMEGLRKSIHTSRTLDSGARARAPAKLIAVVVFPSPTEGLVTASTCRPMSLCLNSIMWASTRYRPASNETGARRLTKCSSMSGGSAVSSRVVSGALAIEHPDQLFISLGDVVGCRNKDRQADEGQSSSKPGLPLSSRGIGVGHNTGDGHQHGHLGEGLEFAQRVKRRITMFDQSDRPAG